MLFVSILTIYIIAAFCLASSHKFLIYLVSWYNNFGSTYDAYATYVVLIKMCQNAFNAF